MTANVEIRKSAEYEDDEEEDTRSPKFPKMPILYLELLENPSRVKPEFIGKDYIPDEEPDDEDNDECLANRSYKNNTHEDERLKRRSISGEKNRTPSKNRSQDDKEYNTEDSQEDRKKDSSSPTQKPPPPTLAELRANKILKSSDYKYPQEEDNEVTQKRNDVFFHYEVLKRMHPNASIPEFTIYSDPDVMAQKYEILAKKLSLDSSVENWKRYMIIFVMGCEVGLGKLNFDMEGFAQQQIASMNTYDQLLVEMAEKSYVPSANRWPVEVRLLMMLTMNIVLFIVSKMLFKRTGTNLLGTINEMTGINKQTPPKMRDP